VTRKIRWCRVHNCNTCRLMLSNSGGRAFETEGLSRCIWGALLANWAAGAGQPREDYRRVARTVLQPTHSTSLCISMGWTGVLRRPLRRERAARAIEVAATHLSAGATMRRRAGSINLVDTCTYPWQNLGQSYRVQSAHRWPTGPMLHRLQRPAQHARHGARSGCRSQQGASTTGATDLRAVD
jgi:hypothetical protein